mmetsp:Transcript_1276/g.2047  ORF Transcript_1276/g.2047 Transcript_1276/m.2047 type:complete len:280 (+) Transcript_1276:497-1336(+)
MTIFHLRKEVQAKLTKNQVLTDQIALLQDRAGNVENLQVEINSLQSKIRTRDSRIAKVSEEFNGLKGENQKLRQTLKEERKKRSRYQPRRHMETGGGRMMAPEEAQAEIQLLRATIEHLQREYNTFKWKETTASLKRDLPPLPTFARDRLGLGVDPSNSASSIGRELKQLASQVLSYRSCPKLVDLSGGGASQEWLKHMTSIRKLGRQARDIQRRLQQAGEPVEASNWGSKIQPTPNARLVGRVTLPCLPNLQMTTSEPQRVYLTGSQMAEICQPLMAW